MTDIHAALYVYFTSYCYLISRLVQGTPCFTAVEVDANKYLFLPRLFEIPKRIYTNVEWKDYEEPKSEDSGENFDLTQPNSLNLGEDAHDVQFIPVCDFRFNPLHDLESFWWVSGHLTLLPGIVQGNCISSDAIAKVRQARLRRFYVKKFIDEQERASILKWPSEFFEAVRLLDPRLRHVGIWLEDFRGLLVEAYHKAEKDTQNIGRTTSAEDLYSPVFQRLTDVWQAFDKNEILLSRATLNMVVQRPEPRPVPSAISHDTGLTFYTTCKSNAVLDIVASARRSGTLSPTNTPTAGMDVYVPTAPQAERVCLVYPDGAPDSLHCSTVRDEPSGDTSTVPYRVAASLTISGSVDGMELCPPSSGPSRQSNSRAPTQSKGQGKATDKGKGTEKGKGKQKERAPALRKSFRIREARAKTAQAQAGAWKLSENRP